MVCLHTCCCREAKKALCVHAVPACCVYAPAAAAKRFLSSSAMMACIRAYASSPVSSSLLPSSPHTSNTSEGGCDHAAAPVWQARTHKRSYIHNRHDCEARQAKNTGESTSNAWHATAPFM